jgi:hypothetical protein
MAQSIYDRCHDLAGQSGGDLGEAMDWIAEAASQGQPVAQAETALEAMSQQLRIRSAAAARSASGTNDPVTDEQNIDGQSQLRTDGRALLRAAVESNDPEVLWSIGTAQGMLAQTYEDKAINELAWWLVSCQRGFDCSSQADWIHFDCPDLSFCAPDINGTDYIRNAAGPTCPAVEQRAQDISAKLDAGKWSELGLGP